VSRREDSAERPHVHAMRTARRTGSCRLPRLEPSADAVRDARPWSVIAVVHSPHVGVPLEYAAHVRPGRRRSPRQRHLLEASASALRPGFDCHALLHSAELAAALATLPPGVGTSWWRWTSGSRDQEPPRKMVRNARTVSPDMAGHGRFLGGLQHGSTVGSSCSR